VRFEASGKAVVSTGPAIEQAKTHVVAGGFGTPQVTLELSTPPYRLPFRARELPASAKRQAMERAPAVALYAAAQVDSRSPPQPDVGYHIDCSTDGGQSWKPVVNDWRIPRRGVEPADFWSQSFCHGSAPIAGKDVSAVRVRFHNTGGKLYLRAEMSLVYQTRGSDGTKVTFDWTDQEGPHRETHVFNPRGAAEWHILTGRNVNTRWVEFVPALSK
jgi:hypothetical protein